MVNVQRIIEDIKTALVSAKANSELLEAAIKEGGKNLKILNNLLKKATSQGQKNQIANAICMVTSYRTQMKMLRQGKTKVRPSHRIKWECMQTAFKNRMRTVALINLHHTDPSEFLKDCRGIFSRRMKIELVKESPLKVNSIFCGEFVKKTAEIDSYDWKYMNTKNSIIYADTNVDDWFKENVEKIILADIEEFQEKDSGWALSAIINLVFNINKYTAQLGSSYIPLPKEIAVKGACINVRNEDEACFAWAVLSALYPVEKHAQRIKNYQQHYKTLNMTGIQFPVTTRQIPRFEHQNNVSINLYILEMRKHNNYVVLPTYLTKAKLEKHINLLMIQNEYWEADEERAETDAMQDPVRYHFVWIKDLSRLLSTQLGARHGRKYFCDRCLHYFYSQSLLEHHIEACSKHNSCKIRLPGNEQKNLRFKNFRNKLPAPFVIYADLECILKKTNDVNKYQNHVPCSIGYFVKCSYDATKSYYKSYRGVDCVQWFTAELKLFAEYLETIYKDPLKMAKLTEKENMQFFKDSTCHICAKPFLLNEQKVIDHCHLSGKFRGAAHNACNINYKDSHTIPIVFHNLSGYDAHFIIANIASDIPGRVDLLPINREKYISFTKHINHNIIQFRFIDSYRFMGSSLDMLSSYLSKFPNLESEFSSLPLEKLNLLKTKGVYPYDYMDSTSKFLENSLPSHKQFYNELNETNINTEQYLHAQQVWKTFDLQNLGEYSDLYLKTDVLLLADVFEQFRSSCLQRYELDPAHYYTLPGYTWDSMLKHTNINLELLTDIDMIMFVERGIRGGLSQCSKRYSKANNKYMEDYDPKSGSVFLLYNDINNQYGWAMSQFLPYGEFKWVEDFQRFDVNAISDDSEFGYILDVDLEYPQNLHDKHQDLPFCPEHKCVSNSKETKLMATLYDKNNYIIHYRNLKQAIRNGLKIIKINKVLEFKQSAWLKSYIDLNTSLRTAAVNDFEKNLFKLMNNAVFGKTMENVRKHCIVKLLTKWFGRYGAEAYISKPQFKSSTIFNENLVAVELNKLEIYFNKPIYIGMCILDLAKTTLYDFHYDYMVPEFDKNCKICYTDTDSLVYEVTCQDVYQHIKKDCYKYFDTSDYPQDNIFGIPRVNKKVLGLMKDENNGKIMSEFIGLRSKMYTFKVVDANDKKKIKGVKRQVVKSRITFNDFKECLLNGSSKIVTQNLIHSRNHEVSSVCQTKTALNPHDDKRYLIKDSYDTLPWGHYKIMECN